jgi:oligopeptide transport system ATP-binding protein
MASGSRERTFVTETPLVEISGLTKHFRRANGPFRQSDTIVRALDDVSLSIARGETMGLVGESGSGKSTFGRCLVGLHALSAGSIRFDGSEIGALSDAARRPYRRRIQMIFQDPYGALNPRMTAGGSVEEHLRAQRFGSGNTIRRRASEILELVGLPGATRNRYPHELSGGQRQRVVIARAMSTHPDFVVADEPVSALDVSTRAQVINLLRELQGRLGLTYLFISHDLSVIAHVCQRVAVMYLGKIVELADRDTLFHAPAHPYTRALLSASPIPDPETERKRARIVLEGDPPDPAHPPEGCRFHTRCPVAIGRCQTDAPEFRFIGVAHQVACHLA